MFVHPKNMSPNQARITPDLLAVKTDVSLNMKPAHPNANTGVVGQKPPDGYNVSKA